MKKVEAKLQFWESEAQKLKNLVGSEDKVWLSWWDLLTNFQAHMKWISKLASDTFKVSSLIYRLIALKHLLIDYFSKTEHFIELFSALGLVYDPNDPYTIQTLIDLKIPDYLDLINAIFKRALNEANHVQQLTAIHEIWSSKLKFKLAKNFPIQLFKSGK